MFNTSDAPNVITIPRDISNTIITRYAIFRQRRAFRLNLRVSFDSFVAESSGMLIFRKEEEERRIIPRDRKANNEK